MHNESNTHKLVLAIERKKNLKISKGNKNTYLEEEQTTQWPKEKNNDLQNIHIKLDRVTRTPLKTGVNAGAPEG